MSVLASLADYWQELTGWLALLDLVLVVLTFAWILHLKKEPISAIAWCLTVLLLPYLGILLFYFFGYQSIHRPLNRKRRHSRAYRLREPGGRGLPSDGTAAEADSNWEALARYAQRVDAFPLTGGNRVEFYSEGRPAFDSMLAAIAAAREHIHIEFFIFRPDDTGKLFVNALAERARNGVEVRLLYDAIGSHSLRSRILRPLQEAGGKVRAFLPLNPLRRRMQINLRNHRKILVVDGKIGFGGGYNIGDEYLGKNPFFGHWRDTFYRLEGPAVPSLQRVFAEDWDFASGEHLKDSKYFPHVPGDGSVKVQVASSGPDQEIKTIREVYFAAILKARRRLWIATPYFVPDAGLRDALCWAGRSGIDVRLLCPFRPDKWVPFLAARYYWPDMLDAGVKVYQYTKGFMHTKMMLIDGAWASVGSANFDNRSLHLNFEVTCLFYTPEAVAELEQQFQRDLASSIRLDPEVYAQRPYMSRLAENACRLLSPIL